MALPTGSTDPRLVAAYDTLNASTRRTVVDPGMDLERRYGGWERRTFAGQDDEIVTMARRAA